MVTVDSSPALTTITQAYRYAIDPTPEQANLLRSHIGGSRFAYNALLGLVKDNWDENRSRKESGEEVPKEDYLGTSHFDLLYLWVKHRNELAPWWAANGSSTYNDAAQRLSRAFANWRKGTAKFPTYKRRGNSGSVRFMNTSVSLSDAHHVRIARIGEVKAYESMRKMHRHLGRGTGRIVAATLSQTSGRWWVSFTVEVQRVIPTTRPPERVIGVDVGITTLYTGAAPDGSEILHVENPRNLVASAQRLARAQRVASRRQGPKKGVAPSNRWRRANARVQQIHADVANARKNLIRETTTNLAKHYDRIVIEDLNVKGMVRNHSIAKHISDASWSEFRRQLEYKTAWYGSELVVADRFYPSSKTCSTCGAVKAKLSLGEREYTCEGCNLVIGRDLNAAINLARWTSQSAAAGTHSVAGRGGKVRPSRQNIDEPAHPVEASTEAPTLIGV